MTAPGHPAPGVRVIGIGASDRGDDAAGLLVARALREIAPPWLDVRECAGDAGGLLTAWEGASRVLVVDAARGRPAGTVERIPLRRARATRTSSTHGLGLAEALGVAAELGVLPPALRIYVVHGASFALGPLTPAVAAAVGPAAERILRDVLDLERRRRAAGWSRRDR